MIEHSIRRYTNADIPALLTILREHFPSFHYGNVYFAEDKVENMLRGWEHKPQFFLNLLVDQQGNIGGGLAASVVPYMFSYEAFATDHITFVVPEHRNLRSITALVTSYVEWAKGRGVREIRWSQSTGYKMDKFPVLAKRLGFTPIGTHFHMELGA